MFHPSKNDFHLTKNVFRGMIFVLRPFSMQNAEWDI